MALEHRGHKPRPLRRKWAVLLKGKGKFKPCLYPIRALGSFLGWAYRATLPDNIPAHLGCT